MLNVKYDFSCVQINIGDDLSKGIIEWGKKTVRDQDLFIVEKEPHKFGRENEIHVTVLYGIHDHNPDLVKEILKEFGYVRFKLGKTCCFIKRKKYDVVVLDVESEDLIKMNKLLTANVKHTNQYGSYKPHLTIAYLKKGKCWNYCNITKWENIEFNSNNLIFSSKNGIKYAFNV